MRIVITGGSSGVGKATAAALAASGHSVMIAARTIPKAERAAADMVGDVQVRHLDLADLASVRAFADSVDSVDILVNNAGVLGLPLTRTIDGFETHMGTNHLGHFALTCLLAEKITDRVVSVGSSAHAAASIHLDDLNWHTRKYCMAGAYAQSKLANMLFVDELARRGVRAYASDPGLAQSDITRDSAGWLYWFGRHLRCVQQSAPHAARASIEASTTDLPSGTYLAPRLGLWGKPTVAEPHEKARDPATARSLWELSAELTGCDWKGIPRQQDTPNA